MSYSLKIPIVKKSYINQRGALGSLSAEKKDKIVAENSSTGTALIVIFYLTFIYIYGSSMYKGKFGYKHGMTLSDAINYSERIGSTVLFVTTTALFVFLLIEKGFVSEYSDDLKRSLVYTCFALLLGFLLLFFIPPSTNNLFQRNAHFTLAGLILFFIVYTSLIFLHLYTSIYETEGLLINLEGVVGTIISLGIAFLVIIFVNLLFVRDKKLKNIFSLAIAFIEILIVVFFPIVIGIVSNLPKLVDYDKICVGILSSS